MWSRTHAAAADERRVARAGDLRIRRHGNDRASLPVSCAAPCSPPIRSSSRSSARMSLVGYRKPSELAGAARTPRHRRRVPQRAATSSARRRDEIRDDDRRPAGYPPRARPCPALDRDRSGGRPGVAHVAAAQRACRRSPRSSRIHRDRGRAAARGPAICGAAGTRACRARRQSQLRAGGRSQSRRGQSGGQDLAHLDARDLERSCGRHRGRRPLLRDADADRRALHAEAFPRSRPRLRGHAQGHRRPCGARAGAGGNRLASVSAIDGERRRLHDARPRAPHRHRRASGRRRSRMRSSKACCATRGSTTAS